MSGCMRGTVVSDVARWRWGCVCQVAKYCVSMTCRECDVRCRIWCQCFYLYGVRLLGVPIRVSCHNVIVYIIYSV